MAGMSWVQTAQEQIFDWWYIIDDPIAHLVDLISRLEVCRPDFHPINESPRLFLIMMTLTLLLLSFE